MTDERLVLGRTVIVLRYVASVRWEGSDRLVISFVGGRVEFAHGADAQRVWRAVRDGGGPSPVVGMCDSPGCDSAAGDV